MLNYKNRLLQLSIISILLFVIAGCSTQTEETNDPYLWLEEVESEKALDWVKLQNDLSDERLINNPVFEPLKERLLKVYNDNDNIIYPELVGEYVYIFWQDEYNERGVWQRMLKTDLTAKGSDWELVLDLDELSKKEDKKWVFHGVEWLKPDNEICLMYLSDGGSDKSFLREFNVSKKEFVKDGFRHRESIGEVSWVDENTVLIARNFGNGTLTTSGYARTLKKWERGTSLDNAKTIFEIDSTNAGIWRSTYYSDQKQHVFIYNAKTFFESELFYYSNDKLNKINSPADAELVGFYRDKLIMSLQSDWDINDKLYKLGTLISIDLTDNIKGEFDIQAIYEPDEKSSFVSMITSKDFITVNTMNNVQNKLTNYEFENGEWIGKTFNAPEFGSMDLIASSDQTNDYFFSYSNFITPTTLYHVNESGLEITSRMKNVFETEDLEVHQYSATSKDKTLVPYFIIHKKDLQLHSSNATVIYAYGGFNSSEQPDYSATTGIGWLEQGGVYVLANIRGGGEFGPSWHQDALKEKRQNSFDDLYAVSEDLISRKITSANNLGIIGGSNGGLLVGVAFTQRPELYNAVVCANPLLDMKRYNKLLAGASWMSEYGNPDIPEEWDYISKYSPYQNISKDKKYPEVFFITSTKDDRVHPGHARKMAEKMNNMGHPYLYHEKIEGGHGVGSTNEQRADSWAKIYTYFNMKLKTN